MEICPNYGKCLICCRGTQENSSISSEKLISNATLLQDFLNCFHINVLDSAVHDLSTTCQFCPTCEQFLGEWSSIQTQMTQLTRRTAQLEATLSALLLSAPHIQEQNHDEDLTEFINNRIQNSQQVELSLLLQQTVDEIRSELRNKYSVRVMLDKIIPLPSALKLEPLPVHYDNDEHWDHWEIGAGTQLPVQVKPEPLLGDNENDDEPWDDWELGADACDEEYLPSLDELDDEDTSEQILGLSTEEETNCDGSNSQHSAHFKGMIVKARNSEKQPSAIRVGPNRFTYNGYDVTLNVEDQCYYCGLCNLKGARTITSILGHIRHVHYTAEDKIKFTAVKTSDTEWIYGGKYQIIKLEEKKYKCVSCGSIKSFLHKMVAHIRTQHVDLEGPDEGPPKLLEPLLDIHDSHHDEPRNNLEFRTHNSEEQCLPSADELNDVETSQKILGMGIKIEEEASCHDSSPDSVDIMETHVKSASSKANGHPAPPKKFPCEICGTELASKRVYQKHVKLHQTGPMKCPTCSKEFLSEPYFKKHMEFHEFGDEAKKHKCEACGKRFFFLQDYKDHVRIHTGEKPYECQVCGRKFPAATYLTQHRRRAHGIEPQSRRVIEVCK